MAREAGAKKVYFASASPEVRYPNVYGIDMPSADELIAHNRDVEAICQAIGADRLIFQSLESLADAAREGNATITRFEDSVFTGEYIAGDVTAEYLTMLQTKRSDAMRQKKNAIAENMQVDCHNDGH